MKVTTNATLIEGRLKYLLVNSYSVCLICCLVILFLIFGVIQAEAKWPRVVPSKDGIPISFEVYGTGEPTLVFVHGWNCDARYWRAQVPHFSRSHRVVTIDLAGHGHSGTRRSEYSILAFGEDVQAVTEAIGSNRVILIGHSMGGSVIAEAARLMPNRVIGLIGVDTLGNIEYPLTREELTKMLAPLEKDFLNGTKEFVEQLILPSMNPQLREWILSDMSAVPSAAALSASKSMMAQYITGEAAKIFEEIQLPVVSVNCDMWPVDYEANRRHMSFYEAIILKGADHFLMLDRPKEFNQALEKAILMISMYKAK